MTTSTKKKNPNKIKLNSSIIHDPRKVRFETYFLDPTRPTFRNALQSALKAGFSKSYALNILSLQPPWVSECIGKLRKADYMVQVHKNINEFLTMDTKEPVITMFGPVVNKETGEAVMKDNTKKMKIKSEVTMFVAQAIDSDFHKKEAAPILNNIQVNLYDLEPADKAKLARLITNEPTSPKQSS